MTTLTIIRPAPVAAPRGAEWAADAAVALYSLWTKWHERRAERRLRQARAEEASTVRRLADSLYAIDPRAAADLYAAADRHERD